MNAQDAEAQYRAAKGQLDAKQITLDEFNRRVSELKYQDNAGTWWAINPADGSWLKWDGAAWVPAFAQAAVQQQATPAGLSVGSAAVQPARNWAGIGSLILGVLSWIFYPVILGLIAIASGLAGLFLAKKQGSKMPATAIIGIILSIISIILINL